MATPAQSQANADLADAVRNWVHFDNLAESLNKQVTNARNLRTQYETKVLNSLVSNGLSNHVLRIGGGASLQRATRFKSAELTWGLLEDHLHEYYRSSGKPDETQTILNFLQRNRGGRTIEYLKKTVTSQSSANSIVNPLASASKLAKITEK
jgi:hypothetical protein